MQPLKWARPSFVHSYSCCPFVHSYSSFSGWAQHHSDISGFTLLPCIPFAELGLNPPSAIGHTAWPFAMPTAANTHTHTPGTIWMQMELDSNPSSTSGVALALLPLVLSFPIYKTEKRPQLSEPACLGLQEGSELRIMPILHPPEGSPSSQ